MATAEMTEAQAVNLVRNALLVAGEEMGKDGDHWPVIKSTVHSIVKDWENLKVERNVHEEMKIHIGKALADLEKSLDQCPADLKPEMNKMMEELWELYEAQFSKTDESKIVATDDEIPVYVKRAKAIVETLEGDND